MFGGIRGSTVAACVAAAAIAAGCGGSDDESTAKDKPVEVSAASQPAEDFMKRMAKLIETTTDRKDCAELVAIDSRSRTRVGCPAPKQLRKSMASFEVTDAGEYGTGAVIEYTSGNVKDGAAIVLTVAPDRNWGLNRMGLLTEPSVGTDDSESRAGYEKAAESYLKAVRERDCDGFAAVAFIVDKKPKKAICKEDFKGTAQLAKRLRGNPDAELRYEGGNETYGFYSLELPKPDPQNITLSIAKASEKSDTPYVVLDVTASPTAAQQKEARKRFEKNQNQPDQPETSPSRKADPPPAVDS